MAPDLASATAPPISYQPNNSGYQVSSSTVPPTSVSAQFTVPTVSDCGSVRRSVALGVLETTSFSFNNVVEPFVQLDCVAGKPTYSAGFKLLGVVTTLATTVSPGDAIAVSASATATATSLTFTDLTTGFTQSANGGGSPPAAAFVGTFPRFSDSGALLLTVPNFTPFSFTNAQVNGANLDTYTGATGLTEFIRTTNGSAPPSGIVQIQPGALSAASFSETRLHP